MRIAANDGSKPGNDNTRARRRAPHLGQRSGCFLVDKRPEYATVIIWTRFQPDASDTISSCTFAPDLRESRPGAHSQSRRRTRTSRKAYPSL